MGMMSHYSIAVAGMLTIAVGGWSGASGINDGSLADDSVKTVKVAQINPASVIDEVVWVSSCKHFPAFTQTQNSAYTALFFSSSIAFFISSGISVLKCTRSFVIG